MLRPIDELPPPWFAIYVKPRHEKNVANALRGKGYDSFLPAYKSGRTTTSELPLFPCYVFCRIPAEYRLPVLTIPGVFFIVGIGKIPAAVDEAEIAALKAVVSSGYPIRPSEFMRAGDRVRIDCGPLRGVEGYFERTSKGTQLIISISLLQRSVAVSIERDSVVALARNISRAAGTQGG